MKYFYLFICMILSGFNVFAQDSANASRPVSIRMRCHATSTDSCTPLFMVDGKQFSYEALSKIDPATIQTIDVLKGSEATALYGSRGFNGVVYVTLKSQDKYVFRVLDEEDSSGINLATVTFVGRNNDSIRLMTGQEGEIETDLLRDGYEYSLSVTAFGYEKFKLPYKAYKGKPVPPFFMKPEVKELEEVIVRGLGYTCILKRAQCTRTVTQYCGFDTVRDSVILNRGTPVITGPTVFPNPVLRGGVVKIELIADDISPKQIRVLNLNGMLLCNLTCIPVKGLNRFDVPVSPSWAAGMYVVQVIDHKGKIYSHHKLLIQ